MIPTDFVGTLPGWATFVALLTIGLRWEILRRRTSTERLTAEANADVSVGGILAAEVKNLRERLDAQAIRFRSEIDALTISNRRALDDMEARHGKATEASEKRHEECLLDRENLRGEVSSLRSEADILRSEMSGLARVIAQASIDRVIMLGGDVPQEIKDAAERAQHFIDGERGKE